MVILVILGGGGRKKIGVAGLMVCLWEGKEERGMKHYWYFFRY